MNNIPSEMLAISPKGIVPVLQLNDSTVIDESLDIMLWALNKSDPDNLLLKNKKDALKSMLVLINRNDNEFVLLLNKYEASARYHDTNEIDCREQCEPFILCLEKKLSDCTYLFGNSLSLADYALLPFIRQFSRVDRKWFQQASYPKLRQWLTKHYQRPLYTKVMAKCPQWLDTKESVLFEM